jgi:hypothetical protein
MTATRRQAYLKAMGFDVWIPKLTTGADDSELMSVPAEETETKQMSPVGACASAIAENFVIGPGAGNTLLLVAKSDEAGTALAADISRSLDCEPVWCWPAGNGSVPGIPLEQAIEERLMTRILVFGPGLVAPGADPAVRVFGSAQMIQTDPVPVLIGNGSSRRALWSELSARHWCAERPRKT